MLRNIGRKAYKAIEKGVIMKFREKRTNDGRVTVEFIGTLKKSDVERTKLRIYDIIEVEHPKILILNLSSVREIDHFGVSCLVGFTGVQVQLQTYNVENAFTFI